MDEQHYRKTYSSINPQRCIFEKAINSRVCNCGESQRFNLADREGVACKSASALVRCKELLQHLHMNARFTLKRIDMGQLGHTQEIRIQNGGLIGIQSQILDSDADKVSDINAVITKALEKYDCIEDLPYSEIMQVINAYRIRAKRTRRNKS